MTRTFTPDNRIKHLGLLPARIIRWIGKHMQSLSRRALVVLKHLALQISCYSKGYCYPSLKTIAAECGYCVRSVQYALKELEHLQLLTIERVPSKSGDWEHNYYRLAADVVAEVLPMLRGAKPTSHPPKGFKPDPVSTIKGGAASTNKRDPLDLEELKERESALERIRQMRIFATDAARGAAHGCRNTER